MKNFLTFTLVAGVAITSAQVAQAAGVSKVGAERTAKAQAQMPGSAATAAARGGFDRAALNRELTRISEMLAPVGSTDDGLTETSAVTKKIGTFSW
jgi:hypothetical protein